MGNSDALVVEFEGRFREVEPGARLTFGRDPGCDIRLDESDVGISRITGCLEHVGQAWRVTNLSRKRAFHVVDHAGFAAPLPVNTEGWPPSSRSVEPPETMLLVAGELWTHALLLRPPVPVSTSERQVPLPRDPLSTRSQIPKLTERRREVLVALARGYLRPYPHYDPRPRTYQEVADLLGLTRSQVTKRVEKVREDLVASGVVGLEGEQDARRPLCEWFLAMRLLVPADLDWLQPRIDRARQARRAELA